MDSGGQIYLRIIESTNLNDDSLTPKVDIEINGIKKSTESIKHTSTPKWNEEFIVSVISRNDRISFKVNDHGLFQDKEIFNTSTSISDIPDNQFLDIWLPKDSQSLKLHVILHFLPYKIEKFFFKHLPKFRMHLENTLYYPGETIRGLVVYNAPHSPTKIRGIRLSLTGKSKASWMATTVTSTGNQGTQVNSSSVTFFDEFCTLFGYERGSNQTIIPDTKTYIFPFEFKLPFKLPPSSKYEYGKVKYQCKTYIDIPMARDKVIKADIDILMPPYTKNNKIKNIKVSLNVSSVFNYKPNIDIKFNSNPVWYIGDKQTSTITLINNNKEAIDKVKISCKSTCDYKSGNHYKSNTHKWAEDVWCNIDGFPIQQGETFQKSICWHIPEKIPLTVEIDKERNIHVKSIVVVKVYIGKVQTFFEFVVTIIKRYSKNYENIVDNQNADEEEKPKLKLLSMKDELNQYLPPPYLVDPKETLYIGGRIVNE